MSNDYTLVDLSTMEPQPSRKSGTPTVHLADELGCREMRPRIWYLSPGDAISYHKQTVQEELYYVLEGPARIRIGDEILDVAQDTAIRIPPETPRQVFNDTENRQTWLIIGAPAVENDGQPLEET